MFDDPRVIGRAQGHLSAYRRLEPLRRGRCRRAAGRCALAVASLMPALATTCCAPSTRPTAQMRSSAASCSSSARNSGPSRSRTAACLLGMHARPWRGCKPRAEDSPTFKVAYPKTVLAGRPLRQPYYSFNLMTWMLAGSGIRKIGPRQVRAAANANSAEGNFEACPACSPSQANQSDEVLTRYVSCPAIAWLGGCHTPDKAPRRGFRHHRHGETPHLGGCALKKGRQTSTDQSKAFPFFELSQS